MLAHTTLSAKTSSSNQITTALNAFIESEKDLEMVMATLSNLIIEKNVTRQESDANLTYLQAILKSEHAQIAEDAILQSLQSLLKKQNKLPSAAFTAEFSPAQMLVWGYLQRTNETGILRGVGILKGLSAFQLNDFLAAISVSQCTSLYLGSNQLGMRMDILKPLLAGLKDLNISFLDLSDNSLPLSDLPWHEFFEYLNKANVKELDLSSNGFYAMYRENKLAFFEAIATSKLSKLTLKKIYLDYFLPDEYTAFFTAVQKAGISSLHLEKCYDPLALAQVQALIPGLKGLKLNALSLKAFRFELLTAAQWGLFFDALKANNVKHLNLSSNTYSNSFAQYTAFFEGLRTLKLSSLNLGWFPIYQFTKEQWPIFFETINATGIESLSLSGNSFNLANVLWADLNTFSLRDDDLWSAFCDGLKTSQFTQLNLHFMYLGAHLTTSQWKQFFYALERANVKSLSLKLIMESVICWKGYYCLQHIM